MKLPGGKLKDLQKHWYKILEDSGFVDIEKMVGGELVLKQSAAHNFWDIHPFDREMDEEYFRVISHKTNDDTTTYRNALDKIIMQMHADGLKAAEIICSLKSQGISKHRHSIRFIVRRYEMAWGIRQYPLSKLNKYE